jgi:hypothetical protein
MKASELTSNGKLVIFDIDDTLVNTDTRVNVVQDGKVIKQLNSHDFTHYKLQPGETFDFGEFKDAREFYTKARPIPGMIKQLKQDIATGNRVIMLTARSDFNDREIFLDTFRRFGIDMSKVHVYRAGNLTVKAATEEKKKIILRHLLGKEHFDKLIMYDDSVPNLNAFLSLKQEYPWSRFYAWHVDPNGQASEYHRTDEALNTGNKDLDEVITLPGISKKGRNLDNLPRRGKPIPRGREKEYLGTQVGKMPGGLQVWRFNEGTVSSYAVFDPDTRRATLNLSGSKYPNNPSSLIIFGVYAARDNPVRAADFYNYLVQELGLTLISDKFQSPGGQRVWQELERRFGRSIDVFAFNTKTDMPVNVGTRDEEETHVTYGELEKTAPGMQREKRAIARDIRLVASPR